MFDKLIVSEPDRGEADHRRNYFLVSTLVVGVLFITGVVISIYAADFSLGTSSFELTELIAPLEMAPPEPIPARPSLPNSATRAISDTPMRRDNIQNIIDSPKAPDAISTTRSTSMSRPADSRFDIGPRDTNPVSSGAGRRDRDGVPSAVTGTGIGRVETSQVEETTTPPPPRVVPSTPKMVAKGVITGEATALPKPDYPAAARAVAAQGKVSVQVTIDEAGNVISARAFDGHPLLRHAAESAAQRAKFGPTKLSGVPVKVTGIIAYNFIR